LPAGKQDQVATIKSESSGPRFPSLLVMIIILLNGILIGLSFR
jgi:hypothetical protein